MPRLPTVEDLGQRPIPQAYRGSPITVPNAGAVASAAGQLGEQIAGMGQHMIEKEDKLNYASAKTVIANEDAKARQELADDPDYGTAEKRYAERMKAAQATAYKIIGSNSDRRLFEADSGSDISRGLAQVNAMVHARAADKGRADLTSSLDSLSKNAIDAPDDATRQNIFTTAHGLISGARDGGFISAEQAGTLARNFTATDAGNRIERSVANDDIDGALHILKSARDALPADRYTDYNNLIQNKMKVRQAADDAYGSAPGYVSADTPVSQPSVGKMISAIRSNESGGRHFGSDGKVLTSSKGATGIMQVMPATGPEAAHLAGLPWDAEKFKNDPSYNEALGVAYFNKQLETFGDPLVAAAAYNAGPGKVHSALKNGGNWLQSLPKETQDYVANFQKKTGAMQSARRWDKESWYKNIDDRAQSEGWSFERTERAKEYADRQISRDENLLTRKEDDADRRAQEFILSNKDSFTDPDSIPRDIWANMSVTARAAAMNTAKANSKPKEVKPNGLEIMQAHAIMYGDPEQFKKLDLTQYVGKVAPSELDQLISEQAKARATPASQPSIRNNISSAITYNTLGDTSLAAALDKKKNPENFVHVSQDMEAYLRSVTGGKREPTDAEVDAAFKRATMRVVVPGAGMFGGDKDKYRFQVGAGQRYQVPVPSDVRARIISSYRKNNGADPPDGLIGRIYVENKGKAGFWP